MRYADLMKRTTVMLPEDLDARVRMEARRRGVSIADIAREAIEQYVARPAPTGHLGFFAVGEGGPPRCLRTGGRICRQGGGSSSATATSRMYHCHACALYAAAASGDRNHRRCVGLLSQTERPLLVPALVVTEVSYLLADRIGPHAELAFSRSIADGEVVVEPVLDPEWSGSQNLRSSTSTFRSGSWMPPSWCSGSGTAPM